jgi:rhodanese-related sulfurtransferase
MRQRARFAWTRVIVNAVVIAAALVPGAYAAGEASKVEVIAPAEAAQQVKAGKATLIDVRERSEIEGGMAEGARWYPTSSIQSDPDAYLSFLASLPKDQTLVFYCASGVRSGKAAAMAADAGRSAANLGGFKDWKAAGLPIAAPAKTLEPG